MTATLQEALRSLDPAAKAVRLNVIVNHLCEEDCGKNTAEIKPLQKVTVGASSLLEAMLRRFSVPSCTPVLAVVNNNLKASLDAFRDGEKLCVSALDVVTQLCKLLSGSLSIEEASESLLGFHVESCSVKASLGVNILNMTVAIAVVTQSPPLFADGAGGEERGALGEVTNVTRPLVGRLSCGSTNNFLLPGPAATAITNLDNKDNTHKDRASLATGGKPVKPPATACPVVACSLLRPTTDGTYGSVSWSAMDKGGAILYKQQQDITNRGSTMYQRQLSDGMGVARLKDSPVETEKVSKNSAQHNLGNGSKVKENKVLPSDRSLAEADIEDVDLYAASWITATGYTVSNMLSADGSFAGKLLARWSKQQDALNADGQPRSNVGGPKCCVPPILTPIDAAHHFRNLGADTYWPRSRRTEVTKATYRAAAKAQEVKFSCMRPHLRKIQDVLDIDVNYEHNYQNSTVIPSLTSRMAVEMQACSADEKDSVEAIWLHAIYGILAHQGSSWSEIGAAMMDLGEVAVNPDLSKLKDTKPMPKVKVEALAKKVEAMVEQEQMEDEEMADEEPPVARQQKQTAKEAGKKAMSMADTLIAAVKKGGKGGKGKKAGQEERKAELKGMKRKTEQKPKGKKQRT